MKKLFMVSVLSLMTVSSTFANSWQVRSTCQKRVNFLGILTVYSVEITYTEYDSFGVATGNSYTTSCTKDGNWDWIW
ncbi:hypothetical protein [Flavobacterium macrobrachii]|uniref:Uncharacterized protein n=1 Tax=Flavobacterium macrobrachii TaxID=591204 RepID=A0ABS2D0V9_9FLAO|nr:hypothetical protein [Flavobacterium macrobrachii]MBM6500784.1 hypothetical protein [Flavobacterium macrobrachii]